VAFLIAAIWLGGKLTYRYGIGSRGTPVTTSIKESRRLAALAVTCA
jgi:hypothetical protein